MWPQTGPNHLSRVRVGQRCYIRARYMAPKNNFLGARFTFSQFHSVHRQLDATWFQTQVPLDTSSTRQNFCQVQFPLGTIPARYNFHQVQAPLDTSSTRYKFHQVQAPLGTSSTRYKFHQVQVPLGTSSTRYTNKKHMNNKQAQKSNSFRIFP